MDVVCCVVVLKVAIITIIIGRFGIDFVFVVWMCWLLDNMNMCYVLLNIMLSPICNWISGFEYCVCNCLLIVEIVLCNVFVNYNLLVFYVLFELCLLLLYYVVMLESTSIYKIRASYYLFIFSCISSYCNCILLMCFYIVIMLLLSRLLLSVCLLLSLSLIIKIPLWPFHDWLSIVHSESSTSISLILAGLILKLGIYAILRYVIPLLYMGLRYLCCLFLILGILGIILVLSSLYLHLDYKIIIALYSVSHMNLTTASIFTLCYSGFLCGIITSIAHGFSSISLFLFVGFLINKTLIRFLDSLWWISSYLRIMLFLLFLSNISFPGSINFIGEILAFLSLSYLDFFLTFFTLILSASLSTSLSFIAINRNISYYSFHFHLQSYEFIVLSSILLLIFSPGFLISQLI